MLIAIISDSHDNIPNLEKFLSWANDHGVEAIIHCGDIAAPAMVSNVIAKNFSGPVHLVFGNVADRELLPQVCSQLPNVRCHGDVGEVKIAAEQFAFCHFPDQAKELAATGKYKIVFYGHTHKPWEEKIGDSRLVNPGTLGGLFYKASFATYDTASGKLELKILERL